MDKNRQSAGKKDRVGRCKDAQIIIDNSCCEPSPFLLLPHRHPPSAAALTASPPPYLFRIAQKADSIRSDAHTSHNAGQQFAQAGLAHALGAALIELTHEEEEEHLEEACEHLVCPQTRLHLRLCLSVLRSATRACGALEQDGFLESAQGDNEHFRWVCIGDPGCVARCNGQVMLVLVVLVLVLSMQVMVMLSITRDGQPLRTQLGTMGKGADSETCHGGGVECEGGLLLFRGVSVSVGGALSGPGLGVVGLVGVEEATAGLEALEVAEGMEDEETLKGGEEDDGLGGRRREEGEHERCDLGRPERVRRCGGAVGGWGEKGTVPRAGRLGKDLFAFGEADKTGDGGRRGRAEGAQGCDGHIEGGEPGEGERVERRRAGGGGGGSGGGGVEERRRGWDEGKGREAGVEGGKEHLGGLAPVFEHEGAVVERLDVSGRRGSGEAGSRWVGSRWVGSRW
jgi:hypothetical protein